MARKQSSATGVPDVAQIVARMRSNPVKGRGQRSPLYLWLRENHSRLVEEFSASAPSWPQLAAALGDGGILNGQGNPPTAEGTRTVWYRVRQEMSGVKKVASPQRLSAVKPIDSDPIPPGASQPETGGEAEAPRRFGTVRVRGGGADEAPPKNTPTPSAEADQPPVDVDDVLSKFMPGATTRG